MVEERGASVPRRTVDRGELVLAGAVVLLGLLVVWQTSEIRLTPAYSKVGPRVIPYLVGGGLIVIGLWLGVAQLFGRVRSGGGGAGGTEGSEDSDPTLATDWRTLGQLVGSLVAYLVLIEPAGFIVASTVLYTSAAFSMGSHRQARDLMVGLLLATILFLGFSRGLGLHLPAGFFAGLG